MSCPTAEPFNCLYASDAQIERTACEALRWDFELPPGRIAVHVSRGWVTLEGSVDWHYQRIAAEDQMRGLAGVRGVTNAIMLVASVAALPTCEIVVCHDAPRSRIGRGSAPHAEAPHFGAKT